jgi:protein gp37
MIFSLFDLKRVILILYYVFEVLTKRAERLFVTHKKINWTHNIWMRASVEDERVIDYIDFLNNIKEHTIFLFLEPLIKLLQNLD